MALWVFITNSQEGWLFLHAYDTKKAIRRRVRCVTWYQLSSLNFCLLLNIFSMFSYLDYFPPALCHKIFCQFILSSFWCNIMCLEIIIHPVAKVHTEYGILWTPVQCCLLTLVHAIGKDIPSGIFWVVCFVLNKNTGKLNGNVNGIIYFF